MLDLVDKTFHQMPLSVQPLIVLASLFGALMGWDNDLRSPFGYKINERLSGIATIGDDALKL